MPEGDEFDAQAAADVATGKSSSTTASTSSSSPSSSSGDAVAESHAAAEGAPQESSMGSVSYWRESLMSTSPNPRLEDVEDPWNPELGGTARIYRGIMKMADIDALPAVGDILIGAIEAFQNFDVAGGDEGGEESPPDEGGGGGFGGADGV